ncbi:zinc finger HIT domain-containing protein 2 [Anolis carolinensis]|uniref:zinc finger HIT domain-containing protein 2 n=1 Tax=Anolis carolinensis TaxID=28377 RepID=UPI002F2B803F
MEPASSRPGAGEDDLPCGFCPSRRAPYTCPRCLLRFCSVPCYHGHGSCARDFRDRELRLRLQGLRGDAASRDRVREALWRLRELREPGDEQAQVGLGPEEEELWEELTLEEQKAFRKLLSSGAAASLVPLWTPWWEAAAPPALVREVDPRNPGERGLVEERDPQEPLQGGLVEEVDPQEHPEGRDRDLMEKTDPQKPLECDLIEERDPQKPLEPKVRAFLEERDPQKRREGRDRDLIEKTDLQNISGCDLIDERDPQKSLEPKTCAFLEERDPQKPLQGVLVEEVDPQKHSEGRDQDLIEKTDLQKPLECDLIEERDRQKHTEGKDCDLLEKMDPQKPLEGTFMEETDPQEPFGGGKRASVEETGPQNPLEAEGRAFIGERDPQKSLQTEGDLTEQMEPQNPIQAPFLGEVDPRDPLGADKRGPSEEADPQNPLQREKHVFIDKRDPQKPLQGVLIEEMDPQKPSEAEDHVFVDKMDPKKPLQCTFVEERDPQKPLRGAFIEKTGPQNPSEAEDRVFVDNMDPKKPLRGSFVEERDPQKTLVEARDPQDPLEAGGRDLVGERGPQGALQGPRRPVCGAEASRLLRSIPRAIPPLCSFGVSASPAAGLQLPGLLYGYAYCLSLYNGEVEDEEEETLLCEFCETLLDVCPSLGPSPRPYGSVSEALQDASRAIADRRYPECPLGRGGAMAAVARLLSQKAFLLAALSHLGRLLRKGRKRMAQADRSRAFRAGKKCAFLLSWANENEGQLRLLALAAREEGRGQREAGQEVAALRRGLERKWRGKRPPMEKEKKALIEELD